MMAKKKLTVILAAVVSAVSAAPASGVTLLVNGDTPSVRWQRVVDNARVPTPVGNVILRLAPCPNTYEEGWAAACVSYTARTPEIWFDARELVPIHDSSGLVIEPYAHRAVLLFEIGRIFGNRLDASARARFAAIWHRPDGIPWDEPLRPYEQTGPLMQPTGESGVESSAASWFAEAYSLCGLFRTDDTSGLHTRAVEHAKFLPIRLSERDYLAPTLRAQKQLRASCELIQAKRRRHRAS